MGVIYLTTNNINGKKYIGVDSKNDPHYYGSGKIMRLALKKYSRTNFTKEILEENDDSKYLFEREQYWIDKYDAIESTNFYNLCKGGKGGAGTLTNEDSKRIHQEKSKENFGKVAKFRKGKTYEEIYGVEKAKEEKEKRRLSGLGQKHSDERKQKNSEKNKGKIPWNKGKSDKKYIITTPDNVEIEVIGRKEYYEKITEINKNYSRANALNRTKS